MAPTRELLDRILDPVGRALSADAAKQLLALRADPEAQGRMDYLAERCNEGLLTPEERSEYQMLISAANLIAILQSKARAILSSNPAA